MNIINWAFLLLFAVTLNATAKVVVRDGDEVIFTLEKSPRRIISLSPHNTELLFAAGGEDRIIGVSSYSDFPEAAKKIPVVGDSRELDLERIIALKPDLLVVWRQGSSARQIEQLRKLGIPLFFIDEHYLSDITRNIELLGQIMGTEKLANQTAHNLRHQLAVLTSRYANQSPVRLFYQVWGNPLLTLNGQQIISDAIRVCGGVNIFSSQKMTASAVSVEAVLQENPEAIIGTRNSNAVEVGVAMWRRYPTIVAVKQRNLYELNGNWINRAGPRMISGVAELCEKLDQVRRKRI
ncbi:MAG: cobalamin-binding protein [Solimicrobium sp.]|jgi:iron complex transport system substrate-binding protein|nr:cobalamin-binding protein [Solimicrobium sp.]